MRQPLSSSLSERTHHAVDHILIYFAVDYQMARNAVDGFLMCKQ